ncbi:MAG: NUDIX hydrolase [Microthrixaceae bacterium]|nr:NUDIX hydrolase [Microthrixaceae bacterium]
MSSAAPGGAAFAKGTEREVFRGDVISVAVGTFTAPDGTEFEREIVHHPGAVSVVPVTDDDHAVLVRQYRAVVAEHLLEIPAGKRDVPGEPPEETARRELAEEVGLAAGRLEPLARFYNSVGFSDELSHVYLGRDLRAVERDTQGVEEQHMTVERVALDDVPAMIADGRLTDAKTIIGLTLARAALGR